MFSLPMSEHIGCVASSVGNLGPTFFANSFRFILSSDSNFINDVFKAEVLPTLI